MNLIIVEWASFDTVAEAHKTGSMIVTKQKPREGTLKVAKENNVTIIHGQVVEYEKM